MSLSEKPESRPAGNLGAENGTFFAKSAPALKPLIATRRGEVSLFPFMSILASLIGILTLLIGLSMAVNQKKEGMSEEEIERSKQYKSLQLLIKKKKDEQKPPPENKNKLTALEIEKLKLLMLALQAELDKLKDPDARGSEELKKRIKAFEVAKIELQKEQPVFQKKIDELNAKIAAMKEKPQPKESVRVKLPKIGTKMPRNVFFVECNSTGIVIRKRGGKAENITLAELKGDSGCPAFVDFVESAKSTGDYAIIFLLRKSGLESYAYANAIAELDCKAKTSKLPMPNDGKIDLSGFKM
jgi:hypothetical protein